MGRFTITPEGPFEAGTYATIVFRVVIGKTGLKAGGCVKIATPHMGWGHPVCLTPRIWDELLVGTDRPHNPWKPINTTWQLKTSGNATIRLRADENLLYHPKGRSNFPREWEKTYGQWRWWITATVERDELAHGDEIMITYGDTENEPFGVRVQPWPGEEKSYFLAVIDAEGQNSYVMIPGSPACLDIVPGPPEHIVAVLPSVAGSGQDIKIRTNVMDRNLCPPSVPYPGKLEFKTEAIVMDRADSGLSGVVRGKAKHDGKAHVHGTGLSPVDTNPLVIDDSIDERLFWGDLHAQSRFHQWRVQEGRGDSCCSPKDLHAYARDCSMLDFVAITDGGGAYEKSPGWEETQQAAVDCYEPGRYVSLKGWECGCGEEGDKCVVYRSTEIEPYVPWMDKFAMRHGDPSRFHALRRFYREHKERVLTIPHSFMKYMDWSVVDPELDRVMEIYSTWGCYESRTDNPLNSKKKPKNQSAQHVWRSGHLLGITAAGDSHIGYPGRSLPYSDRNWCQCYKAGLCAVYTRELTREGVWDALYNRYCYGTTGVRIVLQFAVNGTHMGSVLEYTTDDDALLRRKIEVRVAGTDLIRRVDILKNNVLIYRDQPGADRAEFTFTDDPAEVPATRDWYYVRVFQADGNAAWSSPIWIGPQGCDTPSASEIE